jgi:hypothetical protein
MCFVKFTFNYLIFFGMIVNGIGALNFNFRARYKWLMPVILAAQEAQIRGLSARSQPRQIVWETLSWKYPTQKKG